MEFVKNLLKGDKYIWGIFIALFIISCIEAFSASSVLIYNNKVGGFHPIVSHMTHLLAGAGIMLIVSHLPPHIFKPLGAVAFLGSIILLVMVQFTPEVNGANRHIYGFQPSEFAKFAAIVLCCTFLASGQKRGEMGIAMPKFYAAIGVPAVLALMIALDNLSTAVLLMTVVICLVYIAGVSYRVLFKIIILPGTLILSIFISLLMFGPDEMMSKGRMGTWKNRLENMFMPGEPLIEQKMNDKNQQVIYGHMAVARGGVMGNVLNSQMRDFLPLAFSDFIFSIIVEELGLVGGVFVLLLYLALLVRASVIFRRCNRAFPALLLLGVSLIIVFQALINMGVGVGLIPVTGQPLPLISRGGTSILATCAYFGIIQSISQSVGIGESDYDDDYTFDHLMATLDFQSEDAEDIYEDQEDEELSTPVENPVEEPEVVENEAEMVAEVQEEETDRIYPY